MLTDDDTSKPRYPSISDWVPEAIGNQKSVKWWRKFCGKVRPTGSDLKKLKQGVLMDEHRIDVVELCARLRTSPNIGLLDCQADGRLKRFGHNTIRPPLTVPRWIKFIKTLFRRFSALLWLGALTSLLSYGIEVAGKDRPTNDNLYLGIILLIVCIISGSFQFYQEERSRSLLHSFKKLVPTYARVRRNAHIVEVPTQNVVIGDIVELQAGDKVPADLRIIASEGLKIDNSSLTGESEPQACDVKCTHIDPWETANLAFFPAVATEGSGRGIVIRTADNTVMARIGHLSEGIEHRETHIAAEIGNLIRVTTVVSTMLAVLMFVLALSFGHNWLDAILILIGLLVASAPESILATAMACLTLTAKKMAKNNCVVKRLDSIETLGSITAICCDKTGTLTQNRMVVSHMWYNETIHKSNIKNDNGVYSIVFDRSDPTGMALVRVAALCNNAEFQSNQEDGVPILDKKTTGSPTDTALLKFASLVLGDAERYRIKNRKACDLPFSSSQKYQLSIHRNENCSQAYFTILLKGAPETVIALCSTILLNGHNVPLTEKHRASFEMAYYDLASRGERVLGLCDHALPPDKFPPSYQFDLSIKNFDTKGFRFLGLISMIDPPRAAVPEAVRRCRDAGIKVIMVTGDYAVTAEAVAKSIGIVTCNVERVDNEVKMMDKEKRVSPRACIIHGEQLKDMKPGRLDDVFKNYDEIVFARTSPQQKLIIVESCQRTGAIVAVTGDGVNDSPALKQADVGIAMGLMGSDVSKDAADMILLDDNFVSIVFGIEEGRLIFENLKKAVAYTLTSNLPELIPFLAFVVCSIPLPLGTIAVICIDLGTDLWPAISLAYERPEGDVMQPKRMIRERLINSRMLSFTYGMVGVLQCAAAFFAYFVVYAENGFHPLRLFGLRSSWDCMTCIVEDSYGQEWGYENRKLLEYTGYTAFFVAIVIVQWADALISKNRYLSIVVQPLNWVLNVGLLFETFLVTLICYCPGANIVFYSQGLRFLWWFPALPFAVLLFVLDELRRYYMRRAPGGFLERETYY